MRLHDPWALALLLLLPLLFFRLLRLRVPRLRLPYFGALSVGPQGARARITWIRRPLILGAFACLIVGLARPQVPEAPSAIHTEGIDIALAVDISGSMLAEDFEIDGERTNRLTAVKRAVTKFLDQRAGDRVGLVVFAGRPYTQCPLTLDHGWLVENLERAEPGMIEDGTAIGSALATAVRRLEASDAKSKVVVLLTDGQNNAGKISPLTAAEAAKTLGYRVYTIAAGTRGLAPMPARDLFGNQVFRPVQVNVDEDTLREIAELTGGRFYRATETEKLEEIYDEIGELEKSEREDIEYLHLAEMFSPFALIALVLLLLEWLLGATWLRTLP